MAISNLCLAQVGSCFTLTWTMKQGGAFLLLLIYLASPAACQSGESENDETDHKERFQQESFHELKQQQAGTGNTDCCLTLTGCTIIMDRKTLLWRPDLLHSAASL